MKKTVIFGAGNLGSVLAAELSRNHEVVGFLDNNKSLWGKYVGGFKVLGGTSAIHELEYDEIVVASTMRYDDIRNALLKEGITDEKFNHEIQNRLLVEVQARENFLRDFAKEYGNDSKSAAVVEGGVFQGMFAREINRLFAGRKLYLFDTFEGFDGKDVDVEKENGFSDAKEGYYYETSVEDVLRRMPYRENVVIRKGRFPETLEGLEEEKFLFVNLDFDLYTPTLEGLRFFYPRMVRNGVILVHDYFTKFYHGVKKAIDDFEYKTGERLLKIPIGDGISIAIIIKGEIDNEKEVSGMRGTASG